MKEPTRADLVRRRFRHTIFAGMAVLLVVTAGAALYVYSQKQAAILAEQEALKQEKIAKDALASATEAANVLVSDFAKEFGQTGMPVNLVLSILERAQHLQTRLELSGVMTPELKYGKAMGLNELAATLATLGHSDRGVAAGEKARVLLEGFVCASSPMTLGGNRPWQAVTT